MLMMIARSQKMAGFYELFATGQMACHVTDADDDCQIVEHGWLL
jgi:hypothetical protein